MDDSQIEGVDRDLSEAGSASARPASGVPVDSTRGARNPAPGHESDDALVDALKVAIDAGDVGGAVATVRAGWFELSSEHGEVTRTLLERLPVRILGAVVNAVSSSDSYSEYSYLYGYGPDADADVSAVGDEIPVLQPGEPQPS